MYICKSKIINPHDSDFIEILSEKSPTFKPTHLQIHTNYKENNIYSSYVQLCNITVMGEPQLINFDGIANIRSRGNSLVFDRELPVNFSVFGSSPGQGLTIQIVNPHDIDVEVNLLLKGESSSEDLLGTHIGPSRRYLFNHFDLKASSTTKIPLNSVTRSGVKFKSNEFQLLCFKSKTDEWAYPYIDNIMINGESQFENIDEMNLNSIFFKELRSFEMKFFPSHGKGTFITLRNPYDHDLDCYITMIG